jgi:DnaJ homolog subfamily C member 19
MVFFLLGLLALLVLMGALGAFSRASVASIKQFGFWMLAIGGLLLAALLLFTGGRWGLVTLVMVGPLLWSWVGQARHGAGPRRPGPRRAAPPSAGMTREEAYQVLGLKPGASTDEIRAAYHRLMRGAHPDTGGSDWLAARINQARDVLLS